MKPNLLLLAVFVAAVPLASCSSSSSIEVPQEVKVEVPVACVNQAPERPQLRSESDLMAMDTYRRTLAAWQDLKRWEIYGAQLEAIAAACSRIPR